MFVKLAATMVILCRYCLCNIMTLQNVPNNDPSLVSSGDVTSFSYDVIEGTAWGDVIVRASTGSNGLKIITGDKRVIASATIGQPVTDGKYRTLAVWNKSKILITEGSRPFLAGSRVVFTSIQILNNVMSLTTVLDTSHAVANGIQELEVENMTQNRIELYRS